MNKLYLGNGDGIHMNGWQQYRYGFEWLGSMVVKVFMPWRQGWSIPFLLEAEGLINCSVKGPPSVHEYV